MGLSKTNPQPTNRALPPSRNDFTVPPNSKRGVMHKSIFSLLHMLCLSVLIGCGGASIPMSPPPVVPTHFSLAPATTTPHAGTAFMITVTALGVSGQTATNYSGTLHFASSASNASLPADFPMSTVSATFSITLNTAGSQTITVTDTNSL